MVFSQKTCYIISMNNTKKITLLLVIFLALTTYSFGEAFYGMAGGFYRTFERFPKENYGRDLDAGNFIIMLNYYPETLPVGWFVRTSFGGIVGGFEWQENKMNTLNIASASDIQISAGPSYKFMLGSMIHIPVSFGLSYTNYREENEGLREWFNYRYSVVDSFYRAFKFGLLGDAAIMVNPVSWLTITALGVNISCDFLHWERGYMEGKFRSISNGQFQFANASAFKLGFYFGVGLRFDSNNRAKDNEEEQ